MLFIFQVFPVDSDLIYSACCQDIALKDRPWKITGTTKWSSMSSIRSHRSFITSIILKRNIFKVCLLVHNNQWFKGRLLSLAKILGTLSSDAALFQTRRQQHIYTSSTTTISPFAVWISWQKMMLPIVQNKCTVLNVLIQTDASSLQAEALCWQVGSYIKMEPHLSN